MSERENKRIEEHERTRFSYSINLCNVFKVFAESLSMAVRVVDNKTLVFTFTSFIYERLFLVQRMVMDQFTIIKHFPCPYLWHAAYT